MGNSYARRSRARLTKAELAELLFERVGLNKREAKDIVDTFFEEIREALGARRFGQALGLRQLPGARQAAPRPGRNPRRARPSPSQRAAWSPSMLAS